MTKQEEIMYEIIGSITSTDLPIVFKGGLVLKLLLKENGFEEIERMTKDIDASWIGTDDFIHNFFLLRHLTHLKIVYSPVL